MPEAKRSEESLKQLDEPALLGNHVEHGDTAELVGLSHHPEVSTGDVPHSARIDLKRALCGVELSEGGRDLLADDQLRGFALALGALGFRRRGGDIALVPVPHRQHDGHAAAYVMKGILNGPGPTAVRQSVE